MEINVSQVGQNFAFSKIDATSDISQTSLSTHSVDTSEQRHPKELSVPAEKEDIEYTDKYVEEIETAVTKLSEFMQTNNRQLNFSVDEASSKLVVKVTDAESGKVIRQIPSEEVLKLTERLQDFRTEVGKTVGLLFDKQI